MSAARMHADQLEIDATLVRRLVASQFPHWSELPLEAVASDGTVNALYRLGDALAVRLPLRRAGEASLRKERDWLPRLAPQLPLAIPEPVACGAPAEDYPCEWSIFRWLDGETWLDERVADPCRAARDLARFVVALRRVDPGGGPHNRRGDRGWPLEIREGWVSDALVALEGEVDVRAARAVWDVARDAPGWDGPPVWFHGDLRASNLLLRGGHLSAAIDFGTAGVGDPACDQAAAWRLFAGESRAVFRRELAGDAASWARARGWALSSALLELAYYRGGRNPGIVAQARRALAELLAELR